MEGYLKPHFEGREGNERDIILKKIISICLEENEKSFPKVFATPFGGCIRDLLEGKAIETLSEEDPSKEDPSKEKKLKYKRFFNDIDVVLPIYDYSSKDGHKLKKFLSKIKDLGYIMIKTVPPKGMRYAEKMNRVFLVNEKDYNQYFEKLFKSNNFNEVMDSFFGRKISCTEINSFSEDSTFKDIHCQSHFKKMENCFSLKECEKIIQITKDYCLGKDVSREYNFVFDDNYYKECVEIFGNDYNRLFERFDLKIPSYMKGTSDWEYFDREMKRTLEKFTITFVNSLFNGKETSFYDVKDEKYELRDMTYGIDLLLEDEHFAFGESFVQLDIVEKGDSSDSFDFLKNKGFFIQECEMYEPQENSFCVGKNGFYSYLPYLHFSSEGEESLWYSFRTEVPPLEEVIEDFRRYFFPEEANLSLRKVPPFTKGYLTFYRNTDILTKGRREDFTDRIWKKRDTHTFLFMQDYYSTWEYVNKDRGVERKDVISTTNAKIFEEYDDCYGRVSLFGVKNPRIIQREYANAQNRMKKVKDDFTSFVVASKNSVSSFLDVFSEKEGEETLTLKEKEKFCQDAKRELQRLKNNLLDGINQVFGKNSIEE